MNTRSDLQVASINFDSPIGKLRVSGTIEGIKEVRFLDESEYGTTYSEPESAFNLIVECRRQLMEYFQGKLRQFDLRLDQPGTSFQQRVWQQLALIQYGDTINYLSLARQLGDPKVIRAAAAANGRNSIAIIIPCHRVIGSSGTLVGYAGGLWRKKWLIEHEQKIAKGVHTLF